MRLTKRGEKPKPTEKLAKAGHGVAKNQKLKSKSKLIDVTRYLKRQGYAEININKRTSFLKRMAKGLQLRLILTGMKYSFQHS